MSPKNDYTRISGYSNDINRLGRIWIGGIGVKKNPPLGRVNNLL